MSIVELGTLVRSQINFLCQTEAANCRVTEHSKAIEDFSGLC